MADDIAALGFSVNSKPLADGTVELDKLAASAKEAEDATKSLADAADKNAAKTTKNAAETKKLEDATKKAAKEVYGLNDALKEGAEAGGIDDILGDGSGIGDILEGAGSIKDLVDGLFSVINPANLATVAITTLTTVAISYFQNLKKDTVTAEDALKRHADLIKTIEDRWPGATKALQEYAKQSEIVLAATARQNTAVLEAAAREAAGLFRTQVELSGLITGGATKFYVDQEFKPFEDALVRLQDQVIEGKPDFDAFYRSINDIVRTDPAGLQVLGDKTILLASAFEEAHIKAVQANKSIGLIGGIAQSQVDQVNELAKALRGLDAIGLDALDERGIALKQLNEGLAGAGGTTEAGVQLLQDRYNAAIARIQDQERRANLPLPGDKPNRESIAPPKDTGAAKAARDAERASNAYRDLIKSVDDRIQQMALEAQLVGMTGVEADAYRLKLELLQKAEDKGRSIGPDQVAVIEEKVAAYQKLAQAAAAATLQTELQFEREQMFRSPTEQRVYSELKSAGIGIETAEGQRLASQIRYNEALSEAHSLASDFASTFIGGIQNGESVIKSFGNAVTGVLNKISSQLIQMAVDNLFQNAFGGSSGGGFLSSLFGGGGGGFAGGGNLGYFPPAPTGGIGLFADGGITNKPAIFGEAGPEAAVPLPDGRHIPVKMMGGGGSNGQQAVHVTVGWAPGSDGDLKPVIRSVSREVANDVSSAHIDQYNRQVLPARVNQINEDPHARG